MTQATADERVTDYLRVDRFMRTFVDARALKTAFELRLIDRLIESQLMGFERLERELRLDRPALELLLNMLVAGGVVTRDDDKIALTENFSGALPYRDVMEAKLDFAGFLAADFLEGFTQLLADPEGFKRNARLFQLFDYRRALESSDENYRQTKAWMRLTTALTRYESLACMQLHDFSAYKNVLDVGGNSGEFMLRLCRAHPEMRATVMDLPLVCRVGEEHLAQEPERPRISFLKSDVRKDPFLRGFDLITFKSMLHDWPDEEAKRFLGQAARTVNPGGSVLIFERGPVPPGDIPFSMIPTLLFFRSYRQPAFYERELGSLGLRDVRTVRLDLEAPFFIVTAARPRA